MMRRHSFKAVENRSGSRYDKSACKSPCSRLDPSSKLSVGWLGENWVLQSATSVQCAIFLTALLPARRGGSGLSVLSPHPINNCPGYRRSGKLNVYCHSNCCSDCNGPTSHCNGPTSQAFVSTTLKENPPCKLPSARRSGKRCLFEGSSLKDIALNRPFLRQIHPAFLTGSLHPSSSKEQNSRSSQLACSVSMTAFNLPGVLDSD